MKRLIIIGEGQTEQAFCKDILQPHFNKFDIFIQNPTISKSGGGIVEWVHLKADIERFLRSSDASVTLLIDYYGIKDKHSFPGWEESKRIPDKAKRMDYLESAMSQDIEETRNRFIPYIQLHEFEGLLFADERVFDRSFTQEEYDDYEYLQATFREFKNPEDINDGSKTAPSKRLERILRDYTSNKPSTKAFWGPMLAGEIGLDQIRRKCPRFNQWIENLEQI
ncbi:DUF4276 family protein [Roseivirga seohaensis]|uniref:DUF4276 family protein n=1 Tax=Roseivirga seohaensis TaxID=1914963 RepID=UPI003BA9491A